MTDRFTPTPLKKLLSLILKQSDSGKHILGIQKDLFFYPDENDSFRSGRFKKLLETPIGVAAGPHTQLAQNIIASWLTGARYIELKTVQTLDELDVSKPCIDMQNEGYNCEWSQELKIQESFNEYLNAWILIHILKDKLKIGSNDYPGFIFNMSVGYDLKGIMKENVQWFFNKMNDAGEELTKKISEIKYLYPNVVHLKISPQISDNITLSTMHGCPPEEIEQIGEYLITERKIHTTIKLNPTLLGAKDLYTIIENSGFNTIVPKEAFEHDLKYSDAINIISNLTEKAKFNEVSFGLKLTNTLESLNNKEVFPEKEPMMYASGAVLHPISVNVARKLQNHFSGQLDISFSGGADAFNIADLVQAGLFPVTVSSDLLKPGGYGRFVQYIDNCRGVKVIDPMSGIEKLNVYADKVLIDKRYKKKELKDPNIKTKRTLSYFDCAFAPCEETCPTNQGIPSYMYYVANNQFEKAYQVIIETNPFPNSTGMICDHTCQSKCTRINYDSPLLIREIKRFVTEFHNQNSNNNSDLEENIINKKVSIIGAGPSGLSCAYFLRKAGFTVNVFEAKPRPGGMVSSAVPSFRITKSAVGLDVKMTEELGVKIHFNYKVSQDTFEEIKENSDFIYIAAGAQDAYKLNIEGSENENVLNPLNFLNEVKTKKLKCFGKNIIVIGGGNTAMDTARTAYRLVDDSGKISIVYRRTIKQMPAEFKEIKDVLDEGIKIVELVSPLKVITENDKVIALRCIRMKLGKKDDSGRARPVEIPGSEFDMPCDIIIPAVGQSLAIDFIDKKDLKVKGNSYQTKNSKIFIGGDALRGASTLINAVGDGRKAAQEIINTVGVNFKTKIEFNSEKSISNDRIRRSVEKLMLNKSKRIESVKVLETELNNRKNFELISSTLTEEKAIKEASRCLMCDEVCNICTTLCPNLALQYYETNPVSYNLQKVNNNIIEEDSIFHVKQTSQIIHIADWCNQCGNCNTFCPTSQAPYIEKPHLYLDKDAFEHDQNGYFFDSDKNTLFAKERGFDFSLKDEGGIWKYQTDNFLVTVDKEDFKIIEFTGASNEEHCLNKAAQMSVIFKAANKLNL